MFARLAVLAALLSGCLPLHAALQSAEGELELLAARKPLEVAVRDRRIPARVRALLARIPAVKRYGEANGLRATSNYEDYVQLHRSAVVYVVTACEPLRFNAKTWSFPIAGSFPYLGWFDKRSAQDYAHDLEGDGWDVDVRGASAYSTLGWFRDPVLSSMIPAGPEALGELVNVVLHESVHATLHLEGQSTFNESLASFVADRLTLRYLEKQRGAQPYRDAEARGRNALHELHRGYEELDALYKSQKSDAEKLTAKGEILLALRERLQWKRRLNNASLMGHKTYSSGGQGFARLLESCREDFGCFFGKLRTLRSDSFAKPQEEDLDPVLLKLAGA